MVRACIAEASGAGSGVRRCLLNVLLSCGSASKSLSASSGTTLCPLPTALLSPAQLFPVVDVENYSRNVPTYFCIADA